MRFHEAPSSLPAPLTVDSTGTTGSCLLSDVARELPLVMQQIEACGQPIAHVVLQQPTLQDVFLHLTGRELRE